MPEKINIIQKHLDASQWLSNIWVINNYGVCVFEQSFMKISMDPDLISGFLHAMRAFGKEIADTDIKSINFRDLKLSYRDRKDFFVVIATAENAPWIASKKFLDYIADRFEKEYSKYLIEWDGNITVFDDFGNFLEEIIGKKAFRIKYFKNKITEFHKATMEKRKEIRNDIKERIKNIKENTK